jgi:hypothetical protein
MRELLCWLGIYFGLGFALSAVLMLGIMAGQIMGFFANPGLENMFGAWFCVGIVFTAVLIIYPSLKLDKRM